MNTPTKCPITGEPLTGKATSSRLLFYSLAYYTNEQDADRAGRSVNESGACYAGGVMHGAPCGREPERDYIDGEETYWHAVTY